VNVCAHSTARHNIGPYVDTDVLSSENNGIEYYQVGISSANSIVLHAQKSPKIVGGWGSAPEPAEGAYDAPPDPVVGWGGGKLPPQIPPPRRLWRLDSRAFGARLGAFGASFSFSVEMCPPFVEHLPPPCNHGSATAWSAPWRRTDYDVISRKWYQNFPSFRKVTTVFNLKPKVEIIGLYAKGLWPSAPAVGNLLTPKGRLAYLAWVIVSV